MRLASVIMAGFLVIVSVRPSPADERQSGPQRDAPSVSIGSTRHLRLESRVKDAPAAVLKMFEKAGEPAPTAHALTTAERRKLSAGFAALPPLHRRILGERLQGVSFLDGMPNTALPRPSTPTSPTGCSTSRSALGSSARMCPSG